MSRYSINVGTVANDGTGDSIRTAFQLTNINFADLYARTGISPVVRMLVDGDSIGVEAKAYNADSALFHALATAPVKVVMDAATDAFAIGATLTGSTNNGMTSIARMTNIANRVRDCVFAGEHVVGLMQGGTNNGAAEVVVNDLRIWTDNFINAGGSHVFIMAIDPIVTTTDAQARRALSTNRGLKQLCESRPHQMSFVDSTLAMAASTGLYAPQGGSGIDGVMKDELHPSNRGAYLKGVVLGRALARVLPSRGSNVGPTGDSYSGGGVAPRGNLLGGMGRFNSTGGSASGITGYATVTGAANLPPVSSIGSTGSGTQTLDIAQAPWPAAVADFGRSDILCTRLRFAGTPTSDGTFGLGLFVNVPSDYNPANGPYVAELMSFADKLIGCAGIDLEVAADTAGGFSIGAAGNRALPMLNGVYNPVSPCPRATIAAKPGLFTFSIRIRFLANVEFKGDLYLLGAALNQLPVLPS